MEHSVKPRLDLPFTLVPHLGRKNGGQIFNSDGSALERGRFHFSVIIGSSMRHIISSCVNGGCPSTVMSLHIVHFDIGGKGQIEMEGAALNNELPLGRCFSDYRVTCLL